MNTTTTQVFASPDLVAHSQFPKPPFQFDTPVRCARCEKPTQVPWLIVAVVHPAAPVSVLKCCANCAATMRYAQPGQQQQICARFAERAIEKEVPIGY